MDVVEADFIGGIWDGKSYAIPNVLEWRVAVMRPLSVWDFKEETAPYESAPYAIAVYRRIVNGIYWLSRIEE